MLLRPLFATSFLIDDFLADEGLLEPGTVILASASSKTALATAFLLSRRRGPEVIGLTSAGNLGFVEGLGVYDRAVTYDQVESLPRGGRRLPRHVGRRRGPGRRAPPSWRGACPQRDRRGDPLGAGCGRPRRVAGTRAGALLRPRQGAETRLRLGGRRSWRPGSRRPGGPTWNGPGVGCGSPGRAASRRSSGPTSSCWKGGSTPRRGICSPPDERSAYLLDAVRTPFGRYGGALAGIRPDDLASLALSGLLERSSQLDPAEIDDVLFGDANGAGEDNRNVARMAVLLSGLADQRPRGDRQPALRVRAWRRRSAPAGRSRPATPR